ncbi:UNVERIFIED_CONTAM: hypothetical protein FKN15_041321 [Acipenser sinensis]
MEYQKDLNEEEKMVLNIIGEVAVSGIEGGLDVSQMREERGAAPMRLRMCYSVKTATPVDLYKSLQLHTLPVNVRRNVQYNRQSKER